MQPIHPFLSLPLPRFYSFWQAVISAVGAARRLVVLSPCCRPRSATALYIGHTRRFNVDTVAFSPLYVLIACVRMVVVCSVWAIIASAGVPQVEIRRRWGDAVRLPKLSLVTASVIGLVPVGKLICWTACAEACAQRGRVKWSWLRWPRALRGVFTHQTNGPPVVRPHGKELSAPADRMLPSVSSLTRRVP